MGIGFDSVKKAVLEALNASSLATSSSTTDVSVIETNTEKALIRDFTNPNAMYYGYAPAGTLASAASWKIKKTTVVGSILTDTYADGNLNYDNIWNNRASLTYS